MKFSTGKPPNNLYNRAKEVFDIDWDKGVVFTYGDTIYSKNPISEDLKVHEGTHIVQQGDNPDEWWERYFIDPKWRAEQEKEAYLNQWDYIKSSYNRKARKFMQSHIINSMVRMYGDSFTLEEAQELIR